MRRSRSRPPPSPAAVPRNSAAADVCVFGGRNGEEGGRVDILTWRIRSIMIDAMNFEATASIERRVALHAALADSARLRIVDALTWGDAAPSELAAMLQMPSNLVAHHVNVLRDAGLVERHRSEGDRRRSYLRLVPAALDEIALPGLLPARRVLFVCTANTARSHLAVALWRRASSIPATSAGTHPADRIDARGGFGGRAPSRPPASPAPAVSGRRARGRGLGDHGVRPRP